MTCPRRSDAEALHDGRLEGADRVSFERHLETCAECTNELSLLRRLGEAVKDPADSEAIDARRSRLRLLDAFDRTIVVAPRKPWHRKYSPLLIPVVFAFLLWPRPMPPVVPVGRVVDHATHPRPLKVTLPDGELEDIGTRFTVTVENGATPEVTVTEGKVLLLINGATAALEAGATWHPPVPPPARSSAAVIRTLPPPTKPTALTQDSQ